MEKKGRLRVWIKRSCVLMSALIILVGSCLPASARVIGGDFGNDIGDIVPVIDVYITWQHTNGEDVTTKLPAFKPGVRSAYELYDTDAGFIGICFITVDSQHGIIHFNIEPSAETVTWVEVYSSSTLLIPADAVTSVFSISNSYEVMGGFVEYTYSTISDSLLDDNFSQEMTYHKQRNSLVQIPVNSAYQLYISPSYPTVFQGLGGSIAFAGEVADFTISVPYVTYSQTIADRYPVFRSDLTKSMALTVEQVAFPTDWTGWLSGALDSFMAFEFLPGFSIGNLLWTIIGVAVFVAFMKLLR